MAESRRTAHAKVSWRLRESHPRADTRIHHVCERIHAKKMDARVRPGHGRVSSISSPAPNNAANCFPPWGELTMRLPGERAAHLSS